ncbi:type IV pilus assembly protein PilV [Ectothiorhodospira magna]|uniref:Type IV pilus assembly protein PilV n=1 Tax=Ectothiorhodospira magna TaxID=867345 RepID=A0A1H9B8K3_9GAMM|nr:type IV pilus modification protein PilV [Ectothiorhodospira magna]SEP85077.1 type IV pilus assembly protein PilV [Ectothiorhodospira magna]
MNRKIFHRFGPSLSQRGVTLLEVLIALVVLSIGLLGLAALQATALQHNHNAAVRSQATNLSYDILDRMRANRAAALAGAYAMTLDTGLVCNPALNPSAGTLAQRDLAQWQNQVACQLAAGAAAISPVTNNTVTITLCWRQRLSDEAVAEEVDEDAQPDQACSDQGLISFVYSTRL